MTYTDETKTQAKGKIVLKELIDFADSAFLLPNRIRLAIVKMCTEYNILNEKVVLYAKTIDVAHSTIKWQEKQLTQTQQRLDVAAKALERTRNRLEYFENIGRSYMHPSDVAKDIKKIMEEALKDGK